jgi:hypothetical protein
MPTQAQKFLHSLGDKKRSLTLKTRSGQIVKALPSVVICASQNPNTSKSDTGHKPEEATTSRMNKVPVGFIPLHRGKKPGDTNPNAPYSCEEALRIARKLDSLRDLTWDQNLEHNTFAQVWNERVNLEGQAQQITEEQDFDMKVILALLQFADKTRKYRDIAINNRAEASRQKIAHYAEGALTGRQLESCAYILNKYKHEEKVGPTADPVDAAKRILKTDYINFFEGEAINLVKADIDALKCEIRLAA